MDGVLRRFARLNAALLSEWLRRLADQIDKLEPGPPAVASPVWFLRGKEIQMGSITVKDTDGSFGGGVTFLDAKGFRTEPDDIPAWTSSDEAVATVAADPDGTSGSVTPVAPGAAIIAAVSTDKDGTKVRAEGTVTVQPGEAVIGNIEFSAPTAPAEPVAPAAAADSTVAAPPPADQPAEPVDQTQEAEPPPAV